VASFYFTLLCMSLSAALLAGVLLGLEVFATRSIARTAPGVIAATLGCSSITALCLNYGWFAAGSASLAVVLLAAWPVTFEAVRQRLMRLLTAKAAWALVLGISLIASRYLAAHVLQTIERQPSPQSVDLEDVPVHFTTAFTDAGQTVPLFHFKIHSTSSEIQQFIDANEKDRSQIIRLYEANSASNCHGWVFTGGEFGIRDPDVAAILHYNGYQEVGEPREDDLAIYMDAGQITHSGVVRMVDKHAPILIESKWGPLGVYLHAVEMQPFKGACKFYRSSRASHSLVMRPTPFDS
jgi:hypothetical protein